jgi:hypothetical protein
MRGAIQDTPNLHANHTFERGSRKMAKRKASTPTGVKKEKLSKSAAALARKNPLFKEMAEKHGESSLQARWALDDF